MTTKLLRRTYRPTNHRGHRILRIIAMAFLGVIIAALFALVFGLVVQYLWNWVMPELFGLKAISYLQAFALVILAKIFFGGFGKHHHDHGHDHWGGHYCNSENWKDTLGKNFKRWDYYHNFWEDEGKAAFGAYVERIEKEKNEEN